MGGIFMIYGIGLKSNKFERCYYYGNYEKIKSILLPIMNKDFLVILRSCKSEEDMNGYIDFLMKRGYTNTEFIKIN